MKSIVKRFVSIFALVAIVCTFSLSAFASDAQTAVPSRDEVVSADADSDVEERSLGSVIASGATTIYGGSGKVSAYLPSGNFWADLQAGIGYSQQSGVVTCSVIAPNGTVYDLGAISGSGSFTYAREISYAPAGTYTFCFVSAIPTPYEVVAYIYD